jgi:hypothetical protein
MASVSRKIAKRAALLREAGGPEPVPQEYTPEAEGAPAAARGFPGGRPRFNAYSQRAAVFDDRSRIASLASVRHPKREGSFTVPA